MDQQIENIRSEIMNHIDNIGMTENGIVPLFTASRTAKIIIIGQAPGIKAQNSGIPWDDKSGQRLIEWLGISENQFHDESMISLLPMDFYYPGKGKSGDLPPRKNFAPLWHKRLISLMPDIRLIVLVGQYAQKYYLKNNPNKNLTETVQNYTMYLPKYFPIVHPSPLNFRWLAKNKWFEKELIPNLQKAVSNIIKS